MKKCPFCAGEIQDDVVFCQYCQSNVTIKRPEAEGFQGQGLKKKVPKDWVVALLILVGTCYLVTTGKDTNQAVVQTKSSVEQNENTGQNMNRPLEYTYTNPKKLSEDEASQMIKILQKGIFENFPTEVEGETDLEKDLFLKSPKSQKLVERLGKMRREILTQDYVIEKNIKDISNVVGDDESSILSYDVSKGVFHTTFNGLINGVRFPPLTENTKFPSFMQSYMADEFSFTFSFPEDKALSIEKNKDIIIDLYFKIGGIMDISGEKHPGLSEQDLLLIRTLSGASDNVLFATNITLVIKDPISGEILLKKVY